MRISDMLRTADSKYKNPTVVSWGNNDSVSVSWNGKIAKVTPRFEPDHPGKSFKVVGDKEFAKFIRYLSVIYDAGSQAQSEKVWEDVKKGKKFKV